MTRETKLGLGVAASFLSLVAILGYSTWIKRETPPPPAPEPPKAHAQAKPSTPPKDEPKSPSGLALADYKSPNTVPAGDLQLSPQPSAKDIGPGIPAAPVGGPPVAPSSEPRMGNEPVNILRGQAPGSYPNTTTPTPPGSPTLPGVAPSLTGGPPPIPPALPGSIPPPSVGGMQTAALGTNPSAQPPTGSNPLLPGSVPPVAPTVQKDTPQPSPLPPAMPPFGELPKDTGTPQPSPLPPSPTPVDPTAKGPLDASPAPVKPVTPPVTGEKPIMPLANPTGLPDLKDLKKPEPTPVTVTPAAPPPVDRKAPSAALPVEIKPQAGPETPSIAVPPTKSPLPPEGMRALVLDYRDQRHECGEGDTDFTVISKRFYATDRYAKALQQYNREDGRVSASVREGGRLQKGTEIFIPDAHALEEKFPHLVPSVRPPASDPTKPADPLRSMVPLDPMPSALAPVPAVPLSPVGKQPSPTPATTGAVVPASAKEVPVTVAEKLYWVKEPGKRFYHIAQETLADGNRWAEIWNLNPQYMPDDLLPVNATLRLPPNARVGQ